jgi:RNA polymerase sigma-32 factor
MEQRLSSRDVAFDPAPDADDEEGAYSPSAYLPHPSADPAIAVENEEWDEDSADRVATALALEGSTSAAADPAQPLDDRQEGHAA